MLLLETDYTKQSRGQILTRIVAFLESLAPAKESVQNSISAKSRKS